MHDDNRGFPVLAALARALVYATVFVGVILFVLPARILAWAGVSRPAGFGPAQAAGATLAVLGLALALACVATFAVHGRGTPAPFDPPRRLVVRGPYRVVRNPMYLGAIVLLLGGALYFETVWLAAFAGGFFLATHLFVTLYEEPTLTRLFGDEYLAYRRRVGRWLPRGGADERKP